MPATTGLPHISGLAVVLTADCNLRCAYCYQNAKQRRTPSWETVRAALDLLRDVRGPGVRLLFTGGEPLLEFDLLRRAVDHVESVRPPDLRVHYELVTNGTRLGDEEAAFLAAHRFSTQIGFDGVPAAQDVRAPGTAAALDALLVRLRLAHPAFFRREVSVAITVTPPTIRYLADSVEYFLGRGVADILVSPAFTHQPGWDDGLRAELARQFARIFRVSLERYRRTREVPLQLFRRGLARRPRRVRSLPMCPVADRRHLVVDVDGQVYGCVAFAESYQRFPSAFLEARMARLRMGPIAAPDLAGRLAAFQAAARSSDIFTAKGEKYSSYRRCADCRHLLSCAICPLAIGHADGNDDPRRVPDFPCAFTQVAQTYRARFPRQPTVADLARGRVSPPAAIRRLLARHGAAGPAGPRGPAS
jgi:sulfatase maturation enzyme AslB (radical SAM superfamily)